MKISAQLIFAFIGIFMALANHNASAKKFPVPGQDLWGTWRVDHYDYSEISYPRNEQDVFQKFSQFKEFLPPGQKIKFTYLGMEPTPFAVRTGGSEMRPAATVQILPPFSDNLCNYEVWKVHCTGGKIGENEMLQSNVSNGDVYIYAKIENNKKIIKYKNISPLVYGIRGVQFYFDIQFIDINTLLLKFSYTNPTGGKVKYIYAIWKREIA